MDPRRTKSRRWGELTPTNTILAPAPSGQTTEQTSAPRAQIPSPGRDQRGALLPMESSLMRYLRAPAVGLSAGPLAGPSTRRAGQPHVDSQVAAQVLSAQKSLICAIHPRSIHGPTVG